MSELIEDIRKPISEETPCGEDVVSDEDYQEIREEIDKLTSGTGSVDWNKVVERSRTILAQKSKDLNVATYLCLGLFQLQGFSGLAEGLEGYQILFKDYWECLYPPQDRMRADVLKMLNDHLWRRVRARNATADDVKSLQSINETLNTLNAEIEGKFSDFPVPPIIVKLAEAVSDKLPEPFPVAPEPTPTPTPQPTPIPIPPIPQPVPVSQWKNREEAIDAVKQATKFLRDTNRKDVVPYRLLRAVMWDSLPPSTNGKTRLPAPSKGTQSSLKNLLDAKDWEGLIDWCESKFIELGPCFWLDLQRFLCVALEGLGADYEAVRQAALQETAMFVTRFPKVTELTYDDGTPFADNETKDWLSKTVHPVLGRGEAVNLEKVNINSSLENTTKQSEKTQQVVVSEKVTVEIQIKVFTSR
jgi:type VI secretion system protein VasJ